MKVQLVYESNKIVFTTQIFIFAFFPLCVVAYLLADRVEKIGRFGVWLKKLRAKDVLLIAFSLVFYMWACFDDVFKLIFYILLVYILARWIEAARRRNIFIRLETDAEGESRLYKCLYLAVFPFVLAVSAVLFCLIWYKYLDFILQTWNALFRGAAAMKVITAPLGLSFITFSAISYLTDIYRKQASAGSLIDCALYLSFFPKVISGPIVLWKDFQKQVPERKSSLELYVAGINRMMSGFAKKVILADTFGACLAEISLSNMDRATAVGTLILYMMQIYYDLSGYSDIALGLSALFGFEFKENFHYPYCARSVTEFWRRWHISLGAWFREYVYIPLGGNRVGVLRHIRNLLIVWTLTGLWHGASWNFVVWGFYYGVLLIVEKYLFRRVTERLPVIGTACTMLLVMIGWVFFFSPSLAAAAEYLRVMFGFAGIPLTDDAGMYYLLTNLILFWISWLCSVRLPFTVCDGLWNKDCRKPALLLFYLALFLLCAAYLIHDTYNPFLYFRF